MRKYLYILTVFAVLSTFLLTTLNAQSEPEKGDATIVGVWKAKVSGRNNKKFYATIGIKKVGEIYVVRGVSQHRTITWSGEGKFSGNSFEYSYELTGTSTVGKAVLKMSKDKNGNLVLSGDFEEVSGSNKRKGKESWMKLTIKPENSKSVPMTKSSEEPSKK